MKHVSLSAPTAEDGCIQDFDFSPDVQHAWLEWLRGTHVHFVVYDVSSGSMITNRSDYAFISWHPCKPIVAIWGTGLGNRHLLVWDCMVDHVMYTIQGDFARVRGSKTWSLDGHWLACHCPFSADARVADTRCVQILQAANAQPQVRSPISYVSHTTSTYRRSSYMWYSPDSSKAIVSRRALDCSCVVLDVPTASVLQSCSHDQNVLGFSPRSNVYGTVSDDATVYIYDTARGRCDAVWDLPARAIKTTAKLKGASLYWGAMNNSFWSATGDRIVVVQDISADRSPGPKACGRLFIV